MNADAVPIVCSECFHDQGLRLDAQGLGSVTTTECPNCGATTGHKLTAHNLISLAHQFFVWGSLLRLKYGAAPVIQFNEHQKTSIVVPTWLESDVRLIERKLGVGFFRYGPRLWMVGEVEPLKALQDPSTRAAVVTSILSKYPSRMLSPGETFYRLRKAPHSPDHPDEYDSPPSALAGDGRLDSLGFPVMYGSTDLQVCIHESRVTAEDDIYVATLTSVKSLRLLDLTELIVETGITEFESLDMAIHMLFLAGPQSYPLTRSISLSARSTGFDGIIYPSYFSLLRTGCMPFETAYGISLRRFPHLQPYEKAKTIPNLAVFGRPIADKKIEVSCINRLILHHVEYGVHFGPVGFN